MFACFLNLNATNWFILQRILINENDNLLNKHTEET